MVDDNGVAAGALAKGPSDGLGEGGAAVGGEDDEVTLDVVGFLSTPGVSDCLVRYSLCLRSKDTPQNSRNNKNKITRAQG